MIWSVRELFFRIYSETEHCNMAKEDMYKNMDGLLSGMGTLQPNKAVSGP